MMQNVPPVLVDIILDPYVLNVFPSSLIPTAGYVTMIAVSSWFLSAYIWRLILRIATNSQPENKEQEQAEKKTL
jgi:hypothetical protein